MYLPGAGFLESLRDLQLGGKREKREIQTRYNTQSPSWWPGIPVAHKALVSCPELNSRASRFESSWMNVTLEGRELYIRKAGLGGDCHLVTAVLSSVCSYCHSSGLLCLHDLHGGCFWLLFPSALKDTISQSLRWAFSCVSYILIFLDSFVFLSPFNIWFCVFSRKYMFPDTIKLLSSVWVFLMPYRVIPRN